MYININYLYKKSTLFETGRRRIAIDLKGTWTDIFDCEFAYIDDRDVFFCF